MSNTESNSPELLKHHPHSCEHRPKETHRSISTTISNKRKQKTGLAGFFTRFLRLCPNDLFEASQKSNQTIKRV